MKTAIIPAIADRAVRLALKHGNSHWRFSDVLICIEVAHARNPLRLADLLAADDGNFAHDVFGIVKHLDIGTGAMRDCFSPRFLARA